MTQPITRKRALELAQECLQKEMQRIYAMTFMRQSESNRYAELAAALAYIENMARQKEMHL